MNADRRGSENINDLFVLNPHVAAFIRGQSVLHMDIQNSNADTSLAPQQTGVVDRPRAATPHGLVAHSLASRFLFLHICISLVLSALAYGTVHYWALAVFATGGALTVFLWIADVWRLG